MKIELDDTLGGRSLAKINANFQKIEDALNDLVLFRNNPDGEPNQMEDLLDMNGQRIINLPAPLTPNEPARIQDVQSAIIGLPSAVLLPFTPTGSISATNVQAAILEVYNDIVALYGSVTGAGGIGFQYSQNYNVGTLGWAIKTMGIYPEFFGAVGDGVTDDTTAIQAAITFASLLTGPQYTDSMGQSPYGYGVSRHIKLSGKKYLISSTLVLAGDVNIYGYGGGFKAKTGFTAASYMLDTGTNPYGGRIENLCLDGNDLNVKGLLVQNAHACRIRGLSVVSCRNDGVTYQGGAELNLNDFEVSGSGSPTAVTVAGLRVLGSDAIFANGVVKYTPIGVVANGGGNIEFTNIHTWGLYTAFKQYIGFYFINSVRNTITSCYADSPTKQTYASGNTVVVNGIPNGGVGFYFAAASTQNTLVGCRGYVNGTNYTAAGNPAAAHLVCVYDAADFNAVIGLAYNYGVWWITDVQDATAGNLNRGIRLNTPVVPNGAVMSRFTQTADNGSGTTAMTVQNSVSVPSTSSAVNYRSLIGTTEASSLITSYSTGTYSWAMLLNGIDKIAVNSRGVNINNGVLALRGATVAGGAGEIIMGNSTATVVGAAGGAAALPATPLGYLTIYVNGTPAKIPYYNN